MVILVVYVMLWVPYLVATLLDTKSARTPSMTRSEMFSTAR